MGAGKDNLPIRIFFRLEINTDHTKDLLPGPTKFTFIFFNSLFTFLGLLTPLILVFPILFPQVLVNDILPLTHRQSDFYLL